MSKYTVYGKDYARKFDETIALCNFFIGKLRNRTKKEKVLDRNQNFLPDFLFVGCFSLLEWYFKLIKDSIFQEYKSNLTDHSIVTKYKDMYEYEMEKWLSILNKIQSLQPIKNKFTNHVDYKIIKDTYEKERNAMIHRGIWWKTYQDVLNIANQIKKFLKFCDMEIKKLFKFL